MDNKNRILKLFEMMNNTLQNIDSKMDKIIKYESYVLFHLDNISDLDSNYSSDNEENELKTKKLKAKKISDKEIYIYSDDEEDELTANEENKEIDIYSDDEDKTIEKSKDIDDVDSSYNSRGIVIRTYKKPNGEIYSTSQKFYRKKNDSRRYFDEDEFINT